MATGHAFGIDPIARVRRVRDQHPLPQPERRLDTLGQTRANALLHDETIDDGLERFHRIRKVAVGSATQLSAILDFSDAMIFAMALANMAGLYFLAPVVRAELEGFRARQARLAAGEKAP